MVARCQCQQWPRTSNLQDLSQTSLLAKAQDQNFLLVGIRLKHVFPSLPGSRLDTIVRDSVLHVESDKHGICNHLWAAWASIKELKLSCHNG